MRRFNLNELVWGIILIIFSIVIIYFLRTSHIENLVHPRMNKYILLAAIILFLFGIYQLTKVHTISDRIPIKASNLIFVLALFIMIFPVNKDIVANGLNLGDIKLTTEDIGIREEEHEHFIDNDYIELNEQNFYCNLKEIEKDIDKFIGKKINISGMAYKIKGNEIIIGRIVMSCCIADSQMIAVKGIYKEDIKDGQWVQVTGIIDKTKYMYKGKNIYIPLIKISNLDYIEKPQQKFIYQN